MNRRRVLVVRTVALVAAMLTGCATERAEVKPVEAREPALETEPWAIDVVEGESDIAGLTVAFAEALQRASGAPVVTRGQVTDELNRCSAEPCVTVLRDLFTAAPLVAGGSVSAAGSGFLATGTARAGARVVARASASGASAEAAVRAMAADLGARARAAVLDGELP